MMLQKEAKGNDASFKDVDGKVAAFTDASKESKEELSKAVKNEHIINGHPSYFFSTTYKTEYCQM